MTRTTHRRSAFVIGAVLLAAVAGTRAQAQGEAPRAPVEAQAGAAPQAQGEQIDRTPTDCVLMNRVARNVAANDRQVVFFMRGNTYLRNDLDGACQGLTQGENRLVFHYRTRSAKITRLCDTDSFTVERQISRIGCGLGQFTPVTADEAAALTGRPVPAPSASSSENSERSGGSSRRESRN